MYLLSISPSVTGTHRNEILLRRKTQITRELKYVQTHSGTHIITPSRMLIYIMIVKYYSEV